MYSMAVDHQTQNNSNIHQEGTAGLENIHGYVMPPGSLYQQPNEYQLAYSYPSPVTQQLQFNGNGITGEVKAKKGDINLKRIKVCLLVLSLFVVSIILAIIGTIVLAAFSFYNGILFHNNSPTQFGQTLQSQAVNITTLHKELVSLKSTVTMLETSVNITKSAGLAADLGTLRRFVTNLENQINTTYYSEVANVGNSVTNLGATVIGINEHITNLRSSVNNLEAQMQTTNWQLSNLRNSTSNLNMSINREITNVDSLRGSVTILETRLNTEYAPMTSFSNLEHTVNATSATVMALQSKQRRQPGKHNSSDCHHML